MKKIVPTTKQMRKLKEFWYKKDIIEERYWKSLDILEKEMEEATKIRGIEFFHCDGSIVGIGNTDRTMELLQREDIEDEQ